MSRFLPEGRTARPAALTIACPPVEAFESIVAIALEAEGFVVSAAVKFPVRLKTSKVAYEEWQTHGYEVDLVAARKDKLVLATVKSFFGSAGVHADHVTGATANARKRKRYALLNDSTIRTKVIGAAAAQYGYRPDEVQLRLYAGRFAGKKSGGHEERIKSWARKRRVGAGPIQIIGAADVVRTLLGEADKTQYRDNAALATIKALREAGYEVSRGEV